MSDKLNAKLITPEFRGSFVTVNEPRAFKEGDTPKYSISIPLEKDHPFFKKLDDMVKAVAKEKWGEVPKKLAMKFLKDGDLEDEKYDWGGMDIISASNKSKPGVLVREEDGTLVEPMSPEEIYSGAFYRASIRPYAYTYEKAKGVAISLDNLLKVKDGEKFTSRTSATEDFADFVEGDWD